MKQKFNLKAQSQWLLWPKGLEWTKEAICTLGLALCGSQSIFNITMTSQWAWWRLRSPVSRLFTQPFIRAQIKENIKAPRHWPLCVRLPFVTSIQPVMFLNWTFLCFIEPILVKFRFAKSFYEKQKISLRTLPIFSGFMSIVVYLRLEYNTKHKKWSVFSLPSLSKRVLFLDNK